MTNDQTYFPKKLVPEVLSMVGALDKEPWKLGLFPPCFHASYLARSRSFNNPVIPHLARGFMRDTLW